MSLRGLINQRKRWFYGGLQTIANHKWAAKAGNPWVLKAWVECFLSPFALVYLAALPLIGLFVSTGFLALLLASGLMPLAILGIRGVVGLRLFNQGQKSRLTLLMPLYGVYEMVLNVLLVYLLFAFVSRRGIHIKRGGRVIHAV
jgi:cellulose synthase/poly-beta-1,6-N-acetylglucosamine synthase-like glycosyltransferase